MMPEGVAAELMKWTKRPRASSAKLAHTTFDPGPMGGLGIVRNRTKRIASNQPSCQALIWKQWEEHHAAR